MPETFYGFRPDLFLRARDFESRLRHLAEAGYHVLSLSQALEGLRRRRLPRLPVVITFDDGYCSFLSGAAPALQRRGYPVTVYLNTRDCFSAQPVWELVIQYLFWKTERREVQLAGFAGRDDWKVRPGSQAERTSAAGAVVRWGLARCNEAQRRAVVAELAARLGVDCGPVFEARVLHLMRPDEVVAAARTPGVVIELHTHNHRFPVEKAAAVEEVSENRRLIRLLTGTSPEHFCYPYGEWDVRHWPWLAEENIRSATTCDRGLNNPGTPPFALKRFVDGDAVSPVEFEAEMSGFADMVRRATGRARVLLRAILLRTVGARSVRGLMAFCFKGASVPRPSPGPW
jgi:peptidoglycan/xylan/chitin deacetylase (PgdA/CDA1 family)